MLGDGSAYSAEEPQCRLHCLWPYISHRLKGEKGDVGYRPQLNNINVQPIQDPEVRTTDPQDPSTGDSTMALQNRKFTSEGHI